MVKKIVITGPESSGKTTLARQLALALDTLWVSEHARTYIDNLGRSYEEKDLLEIAKEQLVLEEEYTEKAKRFLICDTDLITIKIWGKYKYGKCDPFILNSIENRKYDLYFLAGIDVPWEFDPQRENPNDRQELYEFYKKELIFYGKPFFELNGNEEDRLKKALMHIEKMTEGKL